MADLAHQAKEYGLKNTSSNEPCWMCGCNKSDSPFNDFRPDAKWRATVKSLDDFAASPPTGHALLQLPGVCAFTFTFDPTHSLEIGAAGASCANVFFDVTFKELDGTKASKLQQVWHLVLQIYDELGIKTNKISKLESTHFSDVSAPHQNYPDIMHSAIKARQCRYLVPVAARLCEMFNKGDSYSKHRLACLSNLNTMYTIVDAHPLFLPDFEIARYARSVDAFLLHYSACAKLSFDNNSFQWSLFPKHHCVAHLPFFAQWLSPRAFWAYGGESMVGTTADLAQSCLSGTAPYKVSKTLCLKYAVGKHLYIVKCS